MLDSPRREIDVKKTTIQKTTMRLLIFRHAKAEKSSPGMRDRDRPLAARGLKDAARMGAYMAHHALAPRHALVSPARRTRGG